MAKKVVSDYLIENFTQTKPGEAIRLFQFGTIYKAGKKRTIDAEYASKFRLPHFKPPIKLGSHEETTPAGGQITRLEVRSDGLYGIPEYTEKGSKALADGDYRYHSPEVIWEGAGFEDPSTGKVLEGPMIVGLALLHTPHLGESTNLYSVRTQPVKMTGDPRIDLDNAIKATAQQLDISYPEAFSIVQAERPDLFEAGRELTSEEKQALQNTLGPGEEIPEKALKPGSMADYKQQDISKDTLTRIVILYSETLNARFSPEDAEAVVLKYVPELADETKVKTFKDKTAWALWMLEKAAGLIGVLMKAAGKSVIGLDAYKIACEMAPDLALLANMPTEMSAAGALDKVIKDVMHIRGLHTYADALNAVSQERPELLSMYLSKGNQR